MDPNPLIHKLHYACGGLRNICVETTIETQFPKQLPNYKPLMSEKTFLPTMHHTALTYLASFMPSVHSFEMCVQRRENWRHTEMMQTVAAQPAVDQFVDDREHIQTCFIHISGTH